MSAQSNPPPDRADVVESIIAAAVAHRRRQGLSPKARVLVPWPGAPTGLQQRLDNRDAHVTLVLPGVPIQQRG